ncbi:Serine/threonine-protein kinase PknB [Enhygromyxa salina]|uniref:Serine/threonine-protein kinase PknB n=1 Tax=Enhygromyxa salina TaxID=215803 RepID=A0A2S9XDN7_9BACT|nr:serine/threonine-protein kinase [Enhygromyxa salina]PRP90972.1 Serine/threonine-protein kinase PknB [Enhygromyxa salina]
MSESNGPEPFARVVSEHNQRLVLSRLFGEQVAAPRLGRYVLNEIVGAGGMGVVYASQDPRLERKVAIKLLRAVGAPAARDRFVREAQVMAKLSHPNVVSVFEIGETKGEDGEVLTFIVMEHVDGVTLSRWLTARARTHAEILALMESAGRGLAAVHAAGLVHGDFKPDNVMIRADGRVLVMDFGLAHELEQPSEASLDTSSDWMLAGTPAYMAPEQLAGRRADAASDQFGFCVALYEALYGERPFAAATLGQLSTEIRERSLRPVAQDSRVPTWLRKVVLRGLAFDPQARWPSIEALLTALADDPAIRRRKWLAVAGGLALVFGGAWGLAALADEQPELCADMADPLIGVWDDDRRAETRAAIEGTKRYHAPATWTRVERRLDDYTRAWVDGRTRACEATQRGEQSAKLLDLRMACLDRRLAHVRATVDILAHADAPVVDRAVQMVWDLPDLARCADIEVLTAEVPPPEDPQLAERVAALDDGLAEAEALRRAGKYTEGLALVEAIVTEAEAIDYEPLRARAWLRRGSLRDRTGDFEGARDTLELAYGAALGQRMADESALAAANLIWIVGARLADHEGGRAWAKHAGPLSRAADVQTRIVYLNHLGNLASAEGEYAEASKLLEQAIELIDAEFGPDHPYKAYALNNLSNVVAVEGRPEAARAYLERSLELKQRVLGHDHPHVASSLENLGTLAAEQGDLEAARTYLERALAHNERVLGPNNPVLATSLGNLGNLAQLEGEHALARDLFERALAIEEAALGPDHPDLAYSLKSLGDVALAEGEQAEAAAYYRRALAIREQALGADHPLVARVLVALGELSSQLGEPDEARAQLERAVAIREAALGPDHPKLAPPLTALGLAAIREGRAGEALAPLTRALDICEAQTVDPAQLARVHFVLAQALWDAPRGLGRDRDRAIAMARAGRSTYAELEAYAAQLAEVEAWLRERS